MNSYNIVKIIEKKRDRFIALIEFNDNKKAILKKLTSSYKPDVKKFNKEIRVLKSIDKIYIPQLLDFGKDYYIIEYFDFYDNRPENFSKYVNDNISNKIIDQLIDFKTTKLKGVKYSKNRPIFNVYRIITKLLINRYRKFFLVKLIFLITLLYFKNLKLFFIKVATKGDFTERNILIKEDVVKFIDFDSYYDKGSWLQDATYLLLHQDVEIENLKWQKKFFVKYLQNVHLNFMRLNKDYIRFWLLLTSLQQFSIRYFQKQKNLVNIDSVLHKEQHIKYFLNKEKFNLFINKIGYNDQL